MVGGVCANRFIDRLRHKKSVPPEDRAALKLRD
jgi:hypothetical protein